MTRFIFVAAVVFLSLACVAIAADAHFVRPSSSSIIDVDNSISSIASTYIHPYGLPYAPSSNCTTCISLATIVYSLIFLNTTTAAIATIADSICEQARPSCSTSAACVVLCSGLIAEHEDEVLDLFIELVSPAAVCAALKSCPAILPPVPDVTTIPVRSTLTNYAGERQWKSWSQTEGTGSILHMSDVHMDTTYKIGSTTVCGLPYCCHASDGPGTDPATTAQYWGDQHCDTTPWLVQDLLNYLTTADQQPDFIIYTGDDPAHDVWAQSRAGNAASLALWSNMLADTLATPQDIPVFNTLGNHEAFPVNQYAGPGKDNWLYEAAVTNWAPNLPADAIATMTYGGYYQARVRPGLRVISLNSNYWINENFWLLANSTYGQDQFNWYADVLAQIAALNERAIILCHAPLHSWSSASAEMFLSITEVHANVIMNYFMGHTHENNYNALHASINSPHAAAGTPLHVAHVAGSINPSNPGFSRYEYSRSSVGAGAVNSTAITELIQQSYHHWLLLPEANAKNNTHAQWSTVRVNLTSTLGVSSLSAPVLAALAPAYLTNPALYRAYESYKYKGVISANPRRPLPDPAKEVVCDTTSASDAQLQLCLRSGGVTEERIAERKASSKC